MDVNGYTMMDGNILLFYEAMRGAAGPYRVKIKNQGILNASILRFERRGFCLLGEY